MLLIHFPQQSLVTRTSQVIIYDFNCALLGLQHSSASPPGGWQPWWCSCRRHHWWWTRCAENTSRLLLASFCSARFSLKSASHLWTSRPEMKDNQGGNTLFCTSLRSNEVGCRVRQGLIPIFISDISYKTLRKIIKHIKNSVICSCTYTMLKLKILYNLG